MKNIFTLLAMAAVLTVTAQGLTPVNDLSLQTVSVEVPSTFSGVFPAGKTLRIPQGYKVRVYYAGGLTKPRFMSFSPEGVLHVSDMGTGGNGKIYALPDTNNDGIADTAIVVSRGYTNNHDVRFYKGDMYVTESTRVWKCTDADDDGIYETKTIIIDNLPGGGNHVTRTLAFDPANQKMYVSIGSSCNVCRENNRAIIQQYNDDGTGGRTYATGVRNAVGMTMHPVTNRLWANNNGSDNQGNEAPYEWMDLVRDNGFYGHPFAYGDQVWFDFNNGSDYQALKPITSNDSARVSTMVIPAAMVRAHSAPMAIQFLNSSFPMAYQNGMLVALRGSWNTNAPGDFRGYKVIYGDLSNAQDTTVNSVGDFCAGFLTDSINRIYWGRPVGLAAGNDGGVYISSDETNKFILKLYRDGDPTGLNDEPRLIGNVGIYPNPSAGLFTLTYALQKPTHVKAVLYDLLGKPVQTVIDERVNSGEQEVSFEPATLTSGFYFLRLSAGNESLTYKIQYVK